MSEEDRTAALAPALVDDHGTALEALFARYRLPLRAVPPGEPIPGSFWGDSEAGLTLAGLHLRPDTPVHSALHEGCHWICMTPARRAMIHRDAGGDDLEECAVCYLQLRLADRLPAIGQGRLMADMDAWGYSFRLGSTRAWFEHDARDARRALRRWRLLDATGQPSYRVRAG